MLLEPSHDRLTALLSGLPERQRQVLLLRYGPAGGEPLSLRQAGKRLSITGERVRLIERDARGQAVAQGLAASRVSRR